MKAAYTSRTKAKKSIFSTDTVFVDVNDESVSEHVVDLLKQSGAKIAKRADVKAITFFVFESGSEETWFAAKKKPLLLPSYVVDSIERGEKELEKNHTASLTPKQATIKQKKDVDEDEEDTDIEDKVTEPPKKKKKMDTKQKQKRRSAAEMTHAFNNEQQKRQKDTTQLQCDAQVFTEHVQTDTPILQKIIRQEVQAAVHDIFVLNAPIFAAMMVFYLNATDDIHQLTKTTQETIGVAMASLAKSKLGDLADISNLEACKEIKKQVAEELKEKFPMYLTMDNNLTPSLRERLTKIFKDKKDKEKKKRAGNFSVQIAAEAKKHNMTPKEYLQLQLQEQEKEQEGEDCSQTE